MNVQGTPSSCRITFVVRETLETNCCLTFILCFWKLLGKLAKAGQTATDVAVRMAEDWHWTSVSTLGKTAYC